MSKILKIIGFIVVIIGFVLFISPTFMFNEQMAFTLPPIAFVIFFAGMIMIAISNYKKKSNDDLNNSYETFSDMIITTKHQDKYCQYCGTKIQDSDNGKCSSCGAIYKENKNDK